MPPRWDTSPNRCARFREDHPDLDLRLRVAPSGAASRRTGCRRDPRPDRGACRTGTSRVRGSSSRPRTAHRGSRRLRPRTADPARPDPPTWGPWVLFAVGRSHTAAVIDGSRCASWVHRSRSWPSRNQPEVLARDGGDSGVGWTVLPVVQSRPDLGSDGTCRNADGDSSPANRDAASAVGPALDRCSKKHCAPRLAGSTISRRRTMSNAAAAYEAFSRQTRRHRRGPRRLVRDHPGADQPVRRLHRRPPVHPPR